MSNILILAESGFGKTTSYMGDEELGIKGLDHSTTYVITATNKHLPGFGSVKKYPVFPNFSLKNTVKEMAKYRRIISNKADVIAHALIELLKVPNEKLHNVILDDTNYVMQDYYMEKALSTGWDAPKKIGFDMGKIFRVVEKYPESGKDFIMIAHGEEYTKTDGRKGYRMKTTGNMVQEYITPEGKFDILLVGSSTWDDTEKRVNKFFVVNDDGVFTSAKSHGIFRNVEGKRINYIPNDLGYAIPKIDAYYKGVEA